MPARAPTKHETCTVRPSYPQERARRLRRAHSTPNLGGLVDIVTGSVPEYLDVYYVGADVGEPDRLGRRLREIELPPIYVRPPVVDLNHHRVAPVTHKQLSPHR